MYDALVFDLDGTLWDSTASVSEAWSRAVEELREELPEVTAEEVARMMGMTMEEIFKKYFPQLSVKRQKAFSDALLAHQKVVLGRQKGLIYQGVAEGLQQLHGIYPLYLVSNCHVPYLEMFYTQTQLQGLFKDWECYGRTGKPKADNLRTLIRRNQIKKAAYIGDTAGDQNAALSAGMDFYHAAYGFGEPDQDCMRFRSFAELTRFFESLRD